MAVEGVNETHETQPSVVYSANTYIFFILQPNDVYILDIHSIKIQQHIKHRLCRELKEHKSSCRKIHYSFISLYFPTLFSTLQHDSHYSSKSIAL